MPYPHAVLVALLALPVAAATLPKAAPEEAGISTGRLQRVSSLMRRYISAGDIAGSVTLVARKGRSQLDGKRLVSRKTVELMTANHIGALPVWNDTLRGYRFGLGFRVREDTGQSALLGSNGSYGWGGAYGTYFWVDPQEQMIGILMIQLMPYAHLNIRPEFQNAATQAIID